MTLIRRPQKKKPPRRRLFNTGRSGVGQRFSHVYSRPTQPLQDSQRDRRNEHPDHITEFVCEDCGDHVHVFGHYYGLPVHSTYPASSANIRHARAHYEHPTCPSTSSRGICEATLSRVAKRKKGPSPRCCHPSEDPRKAKMDD